MGVSFRLRVSKAPPALLRAARHILLASSPPLYLSLVLEGGHDVRSALSSRKVGVPHPRVCGRRVGLHARRSPEIRKLVGRIDMISIV